ncbi:hypothetical protein CMUS01_09342 [Colletotrichum musicola]|uniref:Secreted protein n=1 Tax=Colletotrichum musicola TaxID=2175873 RepID=A0A8H6K8Y1_9PEZI|nr:hypothetical protein CMUS01_09342 [Colletotrichum musicola]
MKSYILLITGFLLWFRVVAAINPQAGPSVTVAQVPVHRTEDPAASRFSALTAAVEATKAGQIGVNPQSSEPTPGPVEAHAKYLTLEKGTTKHRRQPANHKRQGGPACGLSDYVQRVAADAELRNSFARPLVDQVLEEEYDSGYESGEGSEDGWVDGVSEGGAESTVEETIVFSTEEEAEALGETLSSGDAAADAAFGQSTVTAASFVVRDIQHVNFNTMPHGHSDPSIVAPKSKNLGKTHDAEVTTLVTIVDDYFHQVVLAALQDIREKSRKTTIKCPGDLTNVPSKFFLEQTSKAFCQTVMGNLKVRRRPTAYDIYGNKMTIFHAAVTEEEQARRILMGRKPPENIQSYEDYNLFLSYTPLDGKCSVDEKTLCRNSWEKLVKSICGSDDVHRGYLESFVQYCCKGDFPMRAADESIYWGSNYYLLNIRISWIDGCKVTNLQNIKFPIEDDRSITCEKILTENYLSCNNGGAGGWVDAGCLNYDFFVDPK